MSFASRRVKNVRRKKAAHLIERLGQRTAQPLRPRSQFHARADPNQQRVTQHLAEPLERVAGGRLREADSHGGAAHIGFEQQRIERHQQIEIKRIQIHGVNIYHIHYRLEE